MSSNTGIVLLNLGTPDSPKPDDVARYLKQFLMDKWVVDIPALFRWILVHVFIVPKRKITSGHAYEAVWTKRGSPLLFHSLDLMEKVAARMPEHKVVTAMRYGNPSIEKAIKEVKSSGCTDVIVMPLYPQYAESSTRTAIEECLRQAKKLGLNGKVWFVRAFYEHPSFIRAYADLLKRVVEAENPDYVLFSYHGLPERHLRNLDSSHGHCLKQPNCCDQITDVNRNCYRAQSFATTRALIKSVPVARHSISFQSRLGRTPWIKPFTDFVIKDLPKEGVKHLAVITPSFTADCLETVEEIGMRAKEDFLNSGGEKFTRIPCLNSEDVWADAVVEILRETLAGK